MKTCLVYQYPFQRCTLHLTLYYQAVFLKEYFQSVYNIYNNHKVIVVYTRARQFCDYEIMKGSFGRKLNWSQETYLADILVTDALILLKAIEHPIETSAR